MGRKFPPLHESYARGEHPAHGEFHLTRSVTGGEVYLSLDKEDGMYICNIASPLMDAFFEQYEAGIEEQSK